MQIKIFNGVADEVQESKVNNFIKDKNVIDIKTVYQDNNMIQNLVLVVMYEDKNN